MKSVGPLVQEMKMIHGRITVTVQLYRKSTTLPGKGAHGVTAAMDYDDEIRRSIHMRMEISPLPTDTELVTRFVPLSALFISGLLLLRVTLCLLWRRHLSHLPSRRLSWFYVFLCLYLLTQCVCVCMRA